MRTVLTLVLLGLLAGCLTSPQYGDYNNFLFFDETSDSSEWNEYEELVAGKAHTYKDHSYDEVDGVYRFQESTFKPSATVLNLDKMESLEKLKCNKNREQIKLWFSGEEPEEQKKIKEGTVLLFGPRDGSGCPLNRNWYRVEEAKSKKDGVLVLDVAEQDPRELIENLAVNFYQEQLRPVIATDHEGLHQYEEEEEELSASNFRKSAPSEARDMIETILRMEGVVDKRRRYKKRSFLRLLSGAADAIKSKIARVGTRIKSKFEELKTYFNGPHQVNVPKFENGPGRYARDLDVVFNKKWEIKAGGKGSICEASGTVSIESIANFHVNFGFSFLIDKMNLVSAEFNLGLKALFAGTLNVNAQGSCLKEFATFDTGAEFRIPIPPAPGLTVLVHPYARLEGSIHLNLLVEATLGARLTMYGYTRKWELVTEKGEDGDDHKVFKTTGDPAEWKLVPVTPVSPKTEQVNFAASLSLLLTPVVGLKIGASALELIDLKAGPVVHVPLRFSLLFDALLKAEKQKGKRCFLGFQFTAGLKLGATLDLRLFGLQAIEGEWVASIKRKDCKTNRGCDAKLQKQYKEELRKISGGITKKEKEVKEQIKKLGKELVNLKSNLQLAMKEGKEIVNNKKVEYPQWTSKVKGLEDQILEKENDMIAKQHEYDELGGDIFKWTKEKNELLKKGLKEEKDIKRYAELVEKIVDRREEVVKALAVMHVADNALFLTTFCVLEQDATDLKKIEVVKPTTLFKNENDDEKKVPVYLNSDSFLKLFWAKAAEDTGKRSLTILPTGWRTISESEAKSIVKDPEDKPIGL